MKRRLCVAAAFAAAVLLLPANRCGGQESAAGKRSFIWQVQLGNGKAYLLGSMHLARPNLYPLAPAIEEAFRASDVLAVEVDITRMDSGDKITKCVYADGSKLTDHVKDPKDRDRVSQVLEKYGRDIEQMNSYKPWFVAEIIVIDELAKQGYNPRFGLDRHFLEQAGKRPVKELEGADFQMKLLDGVSDKYGAQLLVRSVREVERLGAEMDRVVKAWAEGKPGVVEDMLIDDMKESPELQPVYDRLLFDRNAGMAGKVLEYLKSGQCHFVVVGAAHLVGEKGVLSLLRAKGCEVKQL